MSLNLRRMLCIREVLEHHCMKIVEHDQETSHPLHSYLNLKTIGDSLLHLVGNGKTVRDAPLCGVQMTPGVRVCTQGE